MDRGYFNIDFQTINRADRNIVACASYRSDENLYSERTDENIKFKNHVVKPETMILTPENAPDWTSDRNQLWNEVDRVEKKNNKTENPRLAREVLLSLPNDLDREVQTELAKDFVQNEFVNQGMVADISIHRDDINNPHAHVLLTQRPFNKDGSWGNKTKTKTQYDEQGNPVLNKNGNKVRKQERFGELDYNSVRSNWANKLNYYSKREQSLRQYDSRSFENQGLEKIAEIPLTREEYRLEEREKQRCKKQGIEYQPVTYYGQKNEQIRRYNRGEVSQIFDDKEKEKAQEEIKLFIDSANQSVPQDEETYNVIKDRYKRDVGYLEAKETMKNTFDSASTFGRKIQNDLIKNEIKSNMLKWYADQFDNNPKFKEEMKRKGYNEVEFAKEIQDKFSDVLEEKNQLESRENKRTEIYQSAKDVYLTEIQKNNLIVQQMYPNTHQQYTDDEKAFIVDEAQKGKIISAQNVQLQFKENSQIPTDVLMEDTYKKASKDIFFSQRNMNKYDVNTFEYNVEQMFIKAKEKELNSFKEHIDDDLIQEIGKHKFNQIKDQTPNEKVQLMIKLEKYNNVDVDQVIDKHNRQINNIDNEDRKEDKIGKQETQYNLPSLDLSQILVQYANETERANQINPKKKKKKKKYQNEHFRQ